MHRARVLLSLFPLLLPFLLLVSGAVHAQAMAPAGGTSREDSAQSYSAAGSGGYGYTAQASLPSCGTPRTLVVQNPTTLYFCDGTTWSRVWTSGDGNPVGPDSMVPMYSLRVQAPDGVNGIVLEQPGAKLCFAPGNGMCMWSNSEEIKVNSSMNFGAQSVTLGIIGSGNNQYIGLAGPALWILPVNSTPANPFKGFFYVSNVDGKAYLYNGTEFQPFAMLKSTSTSVDFGAFDAAGGTTPCQTVTATISGALTTDTARCSGLLQLPATVQATCEFTAANTLSVRACNSGGAVGNPDPISITVEWMR